MKIICQIVTVFLSLLFVLFFFGCKSKTETYVSDEGSVTIEREEEEADITIKTKEGETYNLEINKRKLPEGWPLHIPVLPGGEVVLSQTEKQHRTRQVYIETPESLETAYDFYEKRIVSNGWDIKNSVSMQQAKMLNAEKNGENLMLNVAKHQNKTQVQIVIAKE